MVDCCQDKSCALEQLRERQAGTLKIVLMVNAVMFVVVLAAGLYASSTALLADSLDNLGDAVTYALSLYVAWRSERASERDGVDVQGCADFCRGAFRHRSDRLQA